MTITIDGISPRTTNGSSTTNATITISTYTSPLLLVLNSSYFMQGGVVAITPVTVTSPSLTWSLVVDGAGLSGATSQTYSGIWVAWSSRVLTNEVITATRQNLATNAIWSLSVYPLAGTRNCSANVNNASGKFNINIQGGSSGQRTVSLTPTLSSSFVVGGLATVVGGTRTLTSNTLLDVTGTSNDVLGFHAAQSGGSISIGNTTTDTIFAVVALEILAATTTYNDTITETSSASDSIPAVGNPWTNIGQKS